MSSSWRKFRRKVKREIRTLRAVGLWTFLKTIGPRSNWERVLPVQSVRRISIPGFSFSTIDQIVSQIGPTSSGTHSLYLSPDQWAKSPLSSLQMDYPIGCGLKLMKRLGGIDVPYVIEGNSGKIQELMLPSHKQQVLTFNFLYRFGVTPQLYDLLEIDGGGTTCVGYVVEHAPGGCPSAEDCQRIIASFRQLVDENHLRLVNWHGFEGRDFQLPNCNNNIILNAEGRPVYVDVQNFKLINYDKQLMKMVQYKEQISHVGKESNHVGKIPILQSIPGILIPGQQDATDRKSDVIAMLESLRIVLQERIVLDIGCHLGLMGAQYLKYGAKWYHGLDTSQVIPHANAILSSIGCTRFSLAETQLSPNTDVLHQLPPFLHHQLEDSLVSYRSARIPKGWAPVLESFPWTYMIYEGHESEETGTNHAHITEIQKRVPIKILAEHAGGNSDQSSRYVAVLERL